MEENTNNGQEQQPKSWWAWLVIVIVAAAIVGGFYLWPKYTSRNENFNGTVDINENAIDTDTQALEQTATSDAVVDIEQDLNNTDFSNLDKELPDIENEINANR